MVNPRMAVSRLLKSCAMPPARRPTASIFCACCSWRSICSACLSLLARLPTQLGVLQLTVDRGRQPRQIVLQDVIVRARAHRLDRCILADRSRHDDERTVELARLQGSQGLARAEMRHRVVADDDIPRGVGQRRLRSSRASRRGNARSRTRHARAGGRSACIVFGSSTKSTRSVPRDGFMLATD